MTRHVSWQGLVLPIAAVIAWATIPAAGQAGRGAPSGEWPTYGGDLASTRYSALDQINASNFSNLRVAWTFKTDNLGPRPESNLQATPLMIKGVLYFTAGTRRAAVALDAVTGELLWSHSENEGERGAAAPRQLSGRGLAYWTNGRGDDRIVYVTPGYRLVALDAKTGAPVSSFGRSGVVDLKLDNDQVIDPVTGEIGLHSTPIVAGNVIVVGAAHLAGGSPRSRTHVKGYIRGYDARTGKRLWIFHTIPSPGEFGNNTWENNSWQYTGNAGSWAQMTVDLEQNLVFVPVELPTGDYYGGNRPGAGLFGESLVALDLKTGKRKWHYQTVHHGVWDMDLPCAPILADLNVDGRIVKAIALPSKQGWVYVLDRTTGVPVWPIEERPVPKGDVPGEWYSPTQPFVTKPPAFERQGVSVDDLIDFTPELRAQALEVIKNYKIGPIFTPPVASTFPSPIGTLILPSITGGANWQGGSLDPETNVFYIFSNTAVSSVGLVPQDPARGDFGYSSGRAANPNATPGAGRGGRGGRAGGPGAAAPASAPAQIGEAGAEGAPAAPAAAASVFGEGGATLTVQGLPLIKPPYGRITALDLNRGELAWQIAHGETPDNIRNNPALRGLTIPRTGRQGRIGVLTTKTLVIAGEGGTFTAPNGQRGAMLRAYDKATGREVGAVYMPAPQTGSPMTYMVNGRQYITLAIGPGTGAGFGAEMITFSLGN